MPAGRPTTCTPEKIEDAKHYLNNFEAYGDVVPSIAGLARALDVCRRTIYDWQNAVNENAEFSHICAKLLAEQERMLINNGLNGEFNTTIDKLMLSKHGYSDRQEIVGNDGKDLIPENDYLELARRIAFVFEEATRGKDDASD